MSRFAYMTDDELTAEIAAYRKAIRDVTMGGGVGRVAGEGRMMEITRPDVGRAEAALRDLEALARRRGLVLTGSGGAIGVEIG
jgi:Mn-dependent DtxR family transcriptional regulator